MALTADSKQHVEDVAEDVLAQLKRTASAAKAKLGETASLTTDVLAGVNTLTSGSAIQRLREIDSQNRASYELLSREPAIARVVVEDEEGERETYYFCRGDQGMANLGVISYRAPIGRLASLPIGEEFRRPDGRELRVLERTQLRPMALPEGWDSRNTIVETEAFGPITIESLLALLTEVAGEEVTEDILGQLLAEETVKANIFEGVRRSVITKMGLRDQPVLDQYQDEIFRLPLDKRLLILGPPGTGKTTTLIRRLGQKLNTAYLDEGEQRLVDNLATTQGVAHSDSWLMFTPTELLKQYLKEAFAREGVPASDLRIRTWHDYRRELARNAFGVLRTATGGGTFVLKDEVQSLNVEALARPTQWYSDFDAWQRNAYVQESRDAAVLLSQAASSEVRDLGSRLASILERASDGALASTFAALAAELPKVQALVSKLKEASDAKIKGALNLQLNRNRGFLDELARFLDGLQQTQVTDTDEADDLDTDEEEETATPRTGRAAALNAYMQAVRVQARSVAAKRSLSKTSRTGKIVEWLGDRTLTEPDRTEVGASLLVQASARRFVNRSNAISTAFPSATVRSGANASKPGTGIATKASKPAISIRSNWTLCCLPSCAPQAI